MATPARIWRVGEPLSIGDHVARTYDSGSLDRDCSGVIVGVRGSEIYMVERSDGIRFEAGPFDLTLFDDGAA